MALFWTLVAVAAVAAVADWAAVFSGHHRLEYAAKPAVLAALTLAAAALPVASTDLVDRRWWFVAALACCLAGDVFLMLPGDRFVPGLAAFLAGHGLFVVGFLQGPSPPGRPPFAFSATGLVVAAAVVVVLEVVPGTAIVRSLLGEGHRDLVVPVGLYMAAIGTMVVLAANVGMVAALAGAALFLISDTVLAVDRFVHPFPRATVVVHATYHLGQGLLVLSLLH